MKKPKGQFEKNKKLIMDEFDKELEAGVEYLEERLSSHFGGLIGAAIRRVSRQLFSWFVSVGGMERGRKGFEYTIDKARDVEKKSIEEVVEKGRGQYLRHHELYIRSKKSHPSFQDLTEALTEEFRTRLIIYAPLVAAEGEDYAGLVRSAYPEGKDLKARVREHLASTEKVLSLVESADGLLGIPRLLKDPVLKVVRSSFSFMKDRLLHKTDEIYRK